MNSGCVGGGARVPGEGGCGASSSGGGVGGSVLQRKVCYRYCCCYCSGGDPRRRPTPRDSDALLAAPTAGAMLTVGMASDAALRLDQQQPEQQPEQQHSHQQHPLPPPEQQSPPPSEQQSPLPPQLTVATISPAAALSLCGCVDSWTWSKRDRSHEVRLCGAHGDTAHFHPNWSNGTAGVRGTRALNGGVYFWEVRVSQRVFGTSMMFGIGTRRARLHADAFVNLLGEDEHSCGLSHKGVFWQSGRGRQFTAPFRENESTVVGLLFHGHSGTLTYFKDGVCLGVAATGLDACGDELFPVVCSTAAKTEMTLGVRRRCFFNLQDRCRAAITGAITCSGTGEREVDALPLPKRLRTYVKDALQADCGCAGSQLLPPPPQRQPHT